MIFHPIPAPGFHRNPGAYPDQIPPGTELLVQWGCGVIDYDRTYKPPQLRWTLTGHAWDVAAVALAGTVQEGSGDGRQANGSYE